jgi:hypothetical protein
MEPAPAPKGGCPAPYTFASPNAECALRWASVWRQGQSILALLASAERVLAETGDAVALCPRYGEAGTAVITAAAPVLSMAQRHWVGRRAQQLAGVSVAYNLIEAVVAVAAGAVAGSIALIGFGLDSLVEMSSGLVILWQFRHPVPESRERFALRLIGLSFFALAAYVGVGSVRNLIGDSEPAPSAVGIALAGVAASDAGAVVGAAADRTDAQLRKCGR